MPPGKEIDITREAEVLVKKFPPYVVDSIRFGCPNATQRDVKGICLFIAYGALLERKGVFK